MSLKKFFLIGGKLLYNSLLVSAIQLKSVVIINSALCKAPIKILDLEVSRWHQDVITSLPKTVQFSIFIPDKNFHSLKEKIRDASLNIAEPETIYV